MSRKTELATIYRELTALEMRLDLVGAPEIEREVEMARTVIGTKYRAEVEAIARRAMEAI